MHKYLYTILLHLVMTFICQVLSGLSWCWCLYVLICLGYHPCLCCTATSPLFKIHFITVTVIILCPSWSAFLLIWPDVILEIISCHRLLNICAFLCLSIVSVTLVHSCPDHFSHAGDIILGDVLSVLAVPLFPISHSGTVKSSFPFSAAHSLRSSLNLLPVIHCLSSLSTHSL